MSEQLDEAKEESKASAAETAQQDDASASDATPSSSPATGVTASAADEEEDAGESQLQALVGTWTGELTETRGGSHNCFGASEHPLKLVIKSINDSTGQLKADVTVLFHGHRSSDLSSDVDTFDGDKVLTFEDLTGTVDSSGSFKLIGDIEDTDDMSVELNVDCEDYSYGTRLEVSVGSLVDGHADYVHDTYTLTKS